MKRHSDERRVEHGETYTYIIFDGIKNLFFWMNKIEKKIGSSKLLNMYMDVVKKEKSLPFCKLKLFTDDFESIIMPVL